MIEKDEEQIRELNRDNINIDRPVGYYFESNRHGLVAIHNSRILGYTIWSYYIGFTLWDETVVSRLYHGRGLGRKLMNERNEFTPGIIYGACKPDNKAMTHILESMGFTIYQEVEGMLMYARGV